MHLFHKWITTEKIKAEGEWSGLFGSHTEDVICEIQKCQKCPKERGLIHFLNGSIREVSPDFIRNAE